MDGNNERSMISTVWYVHATKVHVGFDKLLSLSTTRICRWHVGIHSGRGVLHVRQGCVVHGT